jgi:tRNA(Ile)-lysidine synthase
MKNRLFPTPPFPPSAKLVVGVSGGSDSVALLSLLKENLRWPTERLMVAHVNYGLRGKDSQKDEIFVRELSRKWGLSFRVLRARFKEGTRRSLQDWAREVRYGFFASLVKRERAWGVAVAHHLEDQAETVLDRLLRGAGPKGLSGLRSVQELALGPRLRPPLKVWRPLLSFSKGELQGFLQEKNIPWREDASNVKLLYRRNQIRHEILPFLSRWNRDLMRKLAQTGEILASEDAWLEDWVEGLSYKLGGKITRNQVSFPRKKLLNLAIPLKRRLIRWAAQQLEPRARSLPFERVEEAMEVWFRQRKGPRDLGLGLSVSLTDQELFIRKSKLNHPLTSQGFGKG